MFFEVTIGKYKFRGEIILMAIALIFIFWSHLLCSCSHVSFSEGMETMKQVSGKVVKKVEGMIGKNNTKPSPSAPFLSPKGKEGFGNLGTGKGGNNYLDEAGEFAPANQPPPDIAKWMPQSLLVTPGEPESQAVKSFQERPSFYPSALNEGQLDLFAKMDFKPECCLENSYASSSTGCACLSKQDYNALRTRFGNNIPYSEF